MRSNTKYKTRLEYIETKLKEIQNSANGKEDGERFLNDLYTLFNYWNQADDKNKNVNRLEIKDEQGEINE